MARKTVSVDKVRNWTNHFLAWEGNSPAERLAVANLCEVVLHDTGNYKGFRYTHTEDAERTPDGYLVTGTYDESRRYYH